jgi:hypothetical protein
MVLNAQVEREDFVRIVRKGEHPVFRTGKGDRNNLQLTEPLHHVLAYYFRQSGAVWPDLAITKLLDPPIVFPVGFERGTDVK